MALRRRQVCPVQILGDLPHLGVAIVAPLTAIVGGDRSPSGNNSFNPVKLCAIVLSRSSG
jgi:hypothetical protein